MVRPGMINLDFVMSSVVKNDGNREAEGENTMAATEL